MKSKLLLIALSITSFAFAQSPVQSYYGTNGVSFTIVGNTINHAAAGANATWNFTGLTSIGESIDTDALPNGSELASFPGTTQKVVTTSTYDNNTTDTFTIFSKLVGGVLSFTAIDNGDVVLNYNTNNAAIGSFPLSYGYSNTDNVSGNYDNGSYAGTFSGSITTSVDAWGTLTVSGAGFTPFSGAVTRLKTTQTLSLNYGAFPNVGTVTETTYCYYPTTGFAPGIPAFRTSIMTISVPLLSLNDNITQNEAFLSAPLATNQFVGAQDVLLAPNPVTDILNIQSQDAIRLVSLTDVTGKIVLTASGSSIDVAHLQKGVYFANIQTDSGSTVKKFIKK
ncbi:T9SS type A sorting domain-containing protein [Flavobacterium caeni]|uniref:Por secretion system C-terminal sorting domain-containing protein n=1 Tax=Flavobacterium caeni TaxID=490189 RepID=A0A1G5I939_9FLAO|nr:T9SS type A sorting domain-containing protein [Flavobacterium caeni]SCY71778.1 Por secretion system C-terminal sorting domain-containing protein [Flavobacterium caeni]